MNKGEVNFNQWNEYKKYLQGLRGPAYFHEMEVWWCSIGLNVGHEEFGKGLNFSRPVIIFRKTEANIFWGIPATTKKRKNLTFVAFRLNALDGFALISQMRSFDSRRLIVKMGKISTSDSYYIRKAVSDISETAFLFDLPP